MCSWSWMSVFLFPLFAFCVSILLGLTVRDTLGEYIRHLNRSLVTNFRVQSDCRLVGWWGETGVCGRNPLRRGDNMLTLYRPYPGIKPRTSCCRTTVLTISHHAAFLVLCVSYYPSFWASAHLFLIINLKLNFCINVCLLLQKPGLS